MTLSGRPKYCRQQMRNSCDTDGKAALKSKKNRAPLGWLRETFIDTQSMSIMLWSMTLPFRKPLCILETQVQASMAALASSLLSTLLTLSGLVIPYMTPHTHP